MKGDFIGFTYGGVHSESLHILRTSDGSRFNENMTPTIQNKTVQVPGGDGTYFFDSYYTLREFSISIAYDSMTERDMRNFKKIFNGKEIKPLIFDETPYKKYFAKVKSAPQLKWICFDKAGARVYKGEGTIQFVCYDPFAHSVKKNINDYSVSNKNEWKDASGLIDLTGYDSFVNNIAKVYNPGDKETDFRLYIPFNSTTNNSATLKEQITSQQFSLINNTAQEGFLAIANLIPNAEDDGFVIDTKAHLLIGYKNSNGKKVDTGNLYNYSITSGDFFKIPVCGENTYKIAIQEPVIGTPILEYDYLYI